MTKSLTVLHSLTVEMEQDLHAWDLNANDMMAQGRWSALFPFFFNLGSSLEEGEARTKYGIGHILVNDAYGIPITTFYFIFF